MLTSLGIVAQLLLAVMTPSQHDASGHTGVMAAANLLQAPREVLLAIVWETVGIHRGEAGDAAGAAADFTRALSIYPLPGAVIGLARARLDLGDHAGVESVARIGLVVVADPSARAELLGVRSDSRARCENWAGAFADAARAGVTCPADPRHPVACGDALVKLKRPAEAAEAYRASLRIDPDFPVAAHRLAWLLSTCSDAAVRDGGTAVTLARRLADPVALSAALAENGDFVGAVNGLRGVLNHVPEPVAADLRRQLACYEKRTPWRE